MNKTMNHENQVNIFNRYYLTILKTSIRQHIPVIRNEFTSYNNDFTQEKLTRQP